MHNLPLLHLCPSKHLMHFDTCARSITLVTRQWEQEHNKLLINWQLHRQSSLTAEHLSICTSLVSYDACRCICASSIHLLLVVCGQVGAAAGWARCFQPSLSSQSFLALPEAFQSLILCSEFWVCPGVSSSFLAGSQPGGIWIRSSNHLSYLDVLIFWWCGYFGSPDFNQDCHGTRFILDDYCGQNNLLSRYHYMHGVCLTINVCYCL